MQVSADLSFRLETPGRPPAEGTLTGSGRHLELRVDNTALFAGRRDIGHLRSVAEMLAASGLSMVVSSQGRPLLELGAVRSRWWQRMVLRSPHLRMLSTRGAAVGAAGLLRRPAPEVLPGAELLPPATPLPLTPTFRRGPRPVTTTHDPRRGGNPRLVLVSGPHGESTRVAYPLRGTVTRIGSGAECEIRLDGLEPVHALLVHDDRDEFVLHDRSSDHSTLVHGAFHADGAVLHTGAVAALAGWRLVFRRAEYADHGRPYGGRIGGELGHQRPQADPWERPGDPRSRRW